MSNKIGGGMQPQDRQFEKIHKYRNHDMWAGLGQVQKAFVSGRTRIHYPHIRV